MHTFNRGAGLIRTIYITIFSAPFHTQAILHYHEPDMLRV